MDGIVVFADSKLELKKIIGVAKQYMLGSIGSGFKPIDDYVVLASLKRRDKTIP
jgi:hypothetical protein